MTNTPKRLIEVDLPIKAISAHARREKSIRHGHISTLHIWWARRPLAACRAVICAALWLDPADELCPQSFRNAVAQTLRTFVDTMHKDNQIAGLSPTLWNNWNVKNVLQSSPDDPACWQDMRYALLHFIADFANWNASSVPIFLQTARALTHAAHLSEERGVLSDEWGVRSDERGVMNDERGMMSDERGMMSDERGMMSDERGMMNDERGVMNDERGMMNDESSLSTHNSSLPPSRPLVVDPFAGGGAIPLEALRVGADAFASDLNPVAVLLNKVVLEYIPRYAKATMTVVDENGEEKVLHGLAEAVRYWGNWVKQQAEQELADYYPLDEDGATPIAYLWARTITCEGPGCGAEVPLMRSLWLAKKNKKSVALRIVPKPDEQCVDFAIIADAKAKDVGEGTVRRGSATCPCCGYTTPVASVRQQLKARRGGAADARMIVVRQNNPKTGERGYRLPNKTDLESTRKAAEELEKRIHEHRGELSLVPDEPLPLMSGVFNVPIYGLNTWGSMFTPRQLLALTTLVRLVQLPTNTKHDPNRDHEPRGSTSGYQQADTSPLPNGRGSANDPGFLNAIRTCLALAVDRLADFNTSLCMLNVVGGRGVVHTFGRQALPMVWDFMETNPFNDVGANWIAGIEAFETTIQSEFNGLNQGQSEKVSATAHPLPDNSVNAFITDPPYYYSVPYADLSDFFYVWLRRTLKKCHPGVFTEPLSPKNEEICEMARWDSKRYSHKDGKWFEQHMAQAMAEGCRILNPSGIGIVVFAHKETTAWEAQLQAMITAGWTITGSWPIDTERPGRLRAQNSAALASSVHLACRPRQGAAIGDWHEVRQELPGRIGDWLPRLTAEGVVGADAIFACLGPALEIFSRYQRVEKPNGDIVTLREYLELVWATVAKQALALLFEDADASNLEPDARLTAMWLWTLTADAATNGESPVADDTDAEPTEATAAAQSQASYGLEYDAARKIAQGLGADLKTLQHLVEVKGSTARLLSVSERTRYLFGKAETPPSASHTKKAPQMTMFVGVTQAEADADGGDIAAPPPGATVLDRVHQAMILFATGRSDAMKRFITEQGAGNDPRFWRLAQTLTALYSPTTEEKRWVDGVLARKKGLGF